MPNIYVVCVILYLTISGKTVIVQAQGGISVTSFVECQSEKIVKFKGNITTKNGIQYANTDVTFPYAMDDNYAAHLYIERSVDGLTFSPGITVREKYACKAANKYLGEAWYAAERAAHAQPGVCPFHAGRYQLKDYALDFSKVPLQTLPAGKIKLTLNLLDKRTKKSTLCLLSAAEIVK